MKIVDKLIAISLIAIPLFLTQCKKLTEEIDCVSPATLNINNITNSSAEASWTKSADAQQYLFEYRKVGATSYTVVRVTSGTSTKIINLASGTTYEYRIQANCPGSNASYTTNKQFTTLSSNEFNIVKKWRMKFYKENNVEIALGANDYMQFASGGGLTQSLTSGGLPVVSTGNWALFSNNDSVSITLGNTKKWKIQSLNTSNFLLIKPTNPPLTGVDSLRFDAF
jgi:hypothetical protein